MMLSQGKVKNDMVTLKISIHTHSPFQRVLGTSALSPWDVLESQSLMQYNRGRQSGDVNKTYLMVTGYLVPPKIPMLKS
jgi:hypothetical protein